MEWNWPLVVLPYDEQWRTQRKLFTQYLHPNNSQMVDPIILEFVQIMLRQLREFPDDFFKITPQYAFLS